MNSLNNQAIERLSELLATLGMQAELLLSNWIAGELLPGQGEYIELLDPVTGLPLVQYRDAGNALVERAVEAATLGQQEWMLLTASERGRRMTAAAWALRGHEETLAQLESVVAGKPIRDCRGEVNKVREMFEYYAGWCDKQHGEVIPVPTSHLNYVRHVPYGVVGQITPWNAPMFTCAWQLAPAIAAGNGVVLKPSEMTPFSSVVIAMLLERSGLPKGLINIVNGIGPTTGAALTGHRGISKLVFVGSPESGRRIAQAGAERLVPSVLELGGKSANIVFADAKLDDAVAGAQAAIFAAAGQSCVAGSRLLVQREVFEVVCERLARAAGDITVGLPNDEATQMGPVQNARQYQHITSMIEKAQQHGARLLCGGRRPEGLPQQAEGYFLAPTVLADVTEEMTIAQEEVFGPVVVVMPFDTEEDAVRLANATRFGLAGAVWTQDPARAHRVAARLRAGTVWINSYKAINVMSPFGGFGDSGFGRSSGVEGLKEYTVAQSVWVETATSASVAMGYGNGVG
ncbi:aldehyde dehydrogenase family protein [Halomonas sp. McH1-25]|uniref:aldehyde dehydrogenase family protein n=1 Tax=unclassified Halomonas TaxID=2609666 RepID=UPI001EF4EDB5|nr:MULTISPECIES: aldehyde dehydrogenase family protein [unclassified Halomonas]MCG7600461.1 aldehyde dehydrogenase family protein [Halomonas sp. McH1-25]MCP1342940.1 aldehyde dehydrogenase family protein [Halomonas sp. FL8]MCP1359968.1 aldehyde dehydrogenase family protein [Halomonas sp. BBD45]MCP1365138.1 aldehyde dehydrogenase family protein [Halomonas sp. BBD48]